VRWQHRLEQTAKWVKEHGRLPLARDEAAVQAEGDDACNLVVWLRRQQVQLRSRRLLDDRIVAMDAVLPGWRPPELRAVPLAELRRKLTPHEQACEDKLRASINAVSAYVREHRHFPVMNLAKQSDMKLALVPVHWRESLARGRLSAALADELDTRLPGWRVPEGVVFKEARWQSSLREIADAITSNGGRLPLWADSMRLRRWLLAQVALQRKGKMPPERMRFLRDALGKCLSADDSLWHKLGSAEE